ncbi:MAG: hypothetical protein IPP94_01310 [Ignavibacteria bacterium]|nr:hypothetical protein [Ignavibacteria bacterium]
MIRRTLLATLICALALPVFLRGQESGLSRLSDDAFLSFLADMRAGRTDKLRIEGAPALRHCGFDLTVETTRRLRSMSGARLQALQSLRAPVLMQRSILSASGRFRMHFDTSGSNAASLIDAEGARLQGTALQYAEAVGRFFDSTYLVEVTETGYAAPPMEAGATAYNVYIKEMGGYYGVTNPESSIPSTTRQPLWTSSIDFDNDFAGNYVTKGLDGARVTAAHEFHHMIQMGTYGTWSNDQYFHEMTSTYCEQLVFPFVHDYYQYLKDFFARPERAFSTYPANDGYNLVLFPVMLDAKHGRGVMLRTWELMKQSDPVTSLDEALRGLPAPSDLGTEYCRLWRWCYFTGTRTNQAVGGERFQNAADFPLAKLASDLPVNDKVTFTGALPPLSSMYARASSGGDAVAFSVTNGDVSGAVQKSMAGVAFTLEAGPAVSGAGAIPIGNGWSYKFTPSAPVFCVSVLGVLSEGAGVSPNPFRPEKDGVIRFGVKGNFTSPRVTLTVFTASMSRVIRLGDMLIDSDASFGRFVSWNGIGDDGELIPSGVYFYTLDGDDATFVGKFAVIRP